MEVLTNYSVNPGALDTGGGYALGFASYGVGTGEVGQTIYVTGAVDGPPGGPTSYARRLTTTAKTGNSTGFVSNSAVNRSPRPGGSAGDVVSAGIWIRYTGPGSTSVNMRTYTYLGGTIVSNADTAFVELPSGVWVWCERTIISAGPYDSIAWWAYQTSERNLPAGSTLDVTGVLCGQPSPYFDGDSGRVAIPGSIDWYVHRWTGTPGLSASIRERVSVSEWTRRWWDMLPSSYRELDAVQNEGIGGFPLLRYMDGAGRIAGGVRDLSDNMWSGAFTDPATVPDYAIRWLAQMMGVPATQRDLPVETLRTYLLDLVAQGRPAAGNRQSIVLAAKRFLTGDRQTIVQPSPTVPHTIMVLVRADEVPGFNVQPIIDGIRAAGVVPAGHDLQVVLANATWDAWEASAGTTWTALEALAPTWAKADSLGIQLE